jgi:hypothetical protein
VAASEKAGDDPPPAASEGVGGTRPAPEAAGGDREVPHPRFKEAGALPLLDSRGGEPRQAVRGASFDAA